MLLLSAITILSLGGYTILLLLLIKGWNGLPESTPEMSEQPTVFVSVIVPFRNEESNLPNLLQCLDQQNYSFHHLEVILANDHSLDNGPPWVKEQMKSRPWLKMVHSQGKGKKQALRTAIASTTGELIVTTDADCSFGKGWIKSHTETYLKENPDLIVAPVSMEGGEALSAGFQTLDYLALQMTTAGAIGLKCPVICSGANLAFRKTAWCAASRSMPGENFLSGDDVFLLHAMKKNTFKTTYLKSTTSIVKTPPAPSLSDFIVQRARWGGKSKAYRDATTLGIALLVFSVNMALVILLVAAFWHPSLFWIWVAAISIKAIADWQLLSRGNRFFSVPLSWPSFILFSLIYPFYVVVAGLAGIMLPVTWKGRKAVPSTPLQPPKTSYQQKLKGECKNNGSTTGDFQP